MPPPHLGPETGPARQTAYAARGMVASASPTAAAVGVEVLRGGGTAVDAAIAVALIEGVTLPASCGLGGDAFAVLYDARSGEVWALNGSGVVAAAASRDYYVARGHSVMPQSGVHSVSVPGAPDAYWTLHRRFGSKPWAALVAPAIDAAEQGVAISRQVARQLKGSHKKLAAHPATAAAYLREGEPPEAGELRKYPQLAQSLRVLAEEGAEPFYRGRIAKEMVRVVKAGSGLLVEEDFAGHETEVYRPLHTTYRGVDVFTTAPPSQGLLILEQLNLLEGFDLATSGYGTVETIHLMVEAKKLAFADRLRHCGDPRFVQNPLEKLLSKEYAAQRRKLIDPQRAADHVDGTEPERLGGDTTSFCVVDGEGNAVSFIHSLSAGFGSGVVAGETGILLNNRAGRGFSLEDGHPNVIEGGKRTMHTLNCYLLMRDGVVYAVGNTPGGDQQPQWNVQTICGLVDFGLDPQQAADAPRFVSWPGTDPAHMATPFEVRMESRFGADVLRALEARGHRVVDQGPWGSEGAIQLLVRRPDGTYAGGSDSRTGGVALGY